MLNIGRMHIVYALSLDFFARKSTEGLLSYGVRGRAGEVGDESPPPPSRLGEVPEKQWPAEVQEIRNNKETKIDCASGRKTNTLG